MAIYYHNSLDRTFHALGDESRRQILATISRKKRCSASELVELFDVAQPTVSKHLKVLESAELVIRHVKGRRHEFTLGANSLQDAQKWLRCHLAFWENSLDSLDHFLDQNNKGKSSG